MASTVATMGLGAAAGYGIGARVATSPAETDAARWTGGIMLGTGVAALSFPGLVFGGIAAMHGWREATQVVDAIPRLRGAARLAAGAAALAGLGLLLGARAADRPA